jgi:hypothetical protein
MGEETYRTRRGRRSARVQSRRGGAGGQGTQRVLVAVDHQHRAAQPADQLGRALGVDDPVVGADGPVLGGDQRLRVGLQAPPDAVLDRLGRVPLGEDPAHEELEELAVVLAPVVLVELGPALGGVEPLG